MAESNSTEKEIMCDIAAGVMGRINHRDNEGRQARLKEMSLRADAIQAEMEAGNCVGDPCSIHPANLLLRDVLGEVVPVMTREERAGLLFAMYKLLSPENQARMLERARTMAAENGRLNQADMKQAEGES